MTREFEDEDSADRTPWIAIKISFSRNKKILRLRDKLSISRHQAMGLVLDLYLQTFVNAWKTGNLSDWGDEDIEEMVGWRGEPGQLAATLREVGIFDPGTSAVHDWVRCQKTAIRHRLRRQQSDDEATPPLRNGRPAPPPEDYEAARKRSKIAAADRRAAEK